MGERVWQLAAEQGANEDGKGTVLQGTATSARSLQHRKVAKSSARASGSAVKQGRAIQKPFAVFDIDGTLIRWQLYHATMDALARLGYLAPTDYEKIRRARVDWKKRTRQNAFKAYETLVVQAFEKIITKVSSQQFQLAVDSVIEEYKDQTYTYTRQLIAQLKTKGYILFAISGSQRELIERIATYYGFDDFVGTDYIQQEGKFTGEKKFYAHDKQTVLEGLIQKHGLSRKNSIAIGDSASDIALLNMVERPIAFNPEKELIEHARKAGWEIIVERKNVVYELRVQDGCYILV